MPGFRSGSGEAVASDVIVFSGVTVELAALASWCLWSGRAGISAFDHRAQYL